MSELPPPINRLGRYDVLRVLGQGAMGVVYEGRDPNLDRRVAIKTVRVTGMPANEVAEYEQRFKTEARSAGRLQHPNIVSVYDAGNHTDVMGQTAFIVMEFVEGQDLKHFLDQGHRFSLEQTAYMVADLLAALDYAHRNKIIHRDIKPANMLLTKDGRIKLTDFGVARITDTGEATKTQGGTVGTLKYMSPEQVAGRGVDASSDLFSTGIVLYQLLTGVRPFDGEGYLDIVSKIVKSDPTPPSRLVAALPPALDQVVAKSLAKSKLDRFSDAASFAQALKAAVNNADLTITPSASIIAELSTGLNTLSGSQSGGSTVTQELELVYWKDIKDTTDPEILEGFLRRFPVGIYADLAKRKLKTIVDQEKTSGQNSRYESTQLGSLTPQTDSTPTGTALDPDVTRLPGDYATEQNTSSPAANSLSDTSVPQLNQASQTNTVTTKHSPEDPTEPYIAAPQAQAAADVKSPASISIPKKPSNKSKSLGLVLAGVAVVAIAGIVWWQQSKTPTNSLNSAANPTTTLVVNASATSSLTATDTVALSASETIVAAPASGTEIILPNTPSAPADNSATSAVATAALRAASSDSAATAARRRASAPGSTLPMSSATGTTSPAITQPGIIETSKPEPSKNHSGSATNSLANSGNSRASGSPKDACEGRILFSYQSCMSEQCNRPVFRDHRICIERREQEERRRLQIENSR